MIVSPSVLSLDYSDTKSQIEELNQSKATWMHFDVMDGHFVPNLTFGPDILKSFVKISDLFKDVHIMVDDPDFFSEVFIKAGAEMITFHYEVMDSDEDIQALIDKIHALGCKAGISIKPNTDVSVLKPFLNSADLFLIMSVEPGFGGQAFMENALDKIRTLKKWICESNSNALIEVDGGINEETGRLCAEAGADVLVAGSYVFKNDIKEATEVLCNM